MLQLFTFYRQSGYPFMTISYSDMELIDIKEHIHKKSLANDG